VPDARVETDERVETGEQFEHLLDGGGALGDDGDEPEQLDVEGDLEGRGGGSEFGGTRGRGSGEHGGLEALEGLVGADVGRGDTPEGVEEEMNSGEAAIHSGIWDPLGRCVVRSWKERESGRWSENEERGPDEGRKLEGWWGTERSTVIRGLEPTEEGR
jgi:hypothetical protein